jgi:hypothetical protein
MACPVVVAPCAFSDIETQLLEIPKEFRVIIPIYLLEDIRTNVPIQHNVVDVGRD